MINYKYILSVLVILLLLISTGYFYSSWKWGNEKNNFLLNDSLIQKKVLDIRDSSGRQIVKYDLVAIRANDLLLSQSNQIEQLKKDLKKAKLKDVHSTVSIATETGGTIDIDLGDTLKTPVPGNDGKIDTSSLSISVSDTMDRFVKVKGIAKFKPLVIGYVFTGLKLNYLIKDTLTVTHALESHLFRKSTMELLITDASPHATIKNVQSYYVDIEKKWYEKWWIHATVGFAAGAFIFSRH